MNKEEDMSGLRKSCLYSCNCNTARMLGINDGLHDFLNGKINEEEALVFLKRLKSFPALVRIAGSEENAFDEKTVFDYWFRQHNKIEVIDEALLRMKITKWEDHIVNIFLTCCVLPGEIMKDGRVRTKRVFYSEDRGFYLSEEKISANPIVNLNLKEGDLVSVHIDQVREKISEEEFQIILESTKDILKKIAL